MSELVRGGCVAHPDRRASITCRFCGDYACSQCTIDMLWGQTLCTRCHERGRARYPVPWEAEMGVGTFVATLRAVFGDLRLMFANLPEGSIWRAFGFAILAHVPMTGLYFLGDSVNGGSAARSGSVAFAAALGSLSSIGFEGGTFFVVHRMLGGKATLGSALRAAAYLSALGLLSAAALFVPFMLAAVIIALTMGMWLWGWMLFARGPARLGRGRAIASVSVVTAVGIVGGFIVMGLSMGIAFAIIGEPLPQ